MINITAKTFNTVYIMIAQDAFALDAATNEFGFQVAQVVTCPRYGERHDFITTTANAQKFIAYCE